MENVKRTLQSCGEKAVYDSKTNKEPFEDALKRHLSSNTNLLCTNFKSDGLFKQYAYPDNRFVSVGNPEKNEDGLIFPFEIKLDFGNRMEDLIDIDSINAQRLKDSYCRNDAIQNNSIPKISLQQKVNFENQKFVNEYVNRQKEIEKYLANRTEVTIGPSTKNSGYNRGSNRVSDATPQIVGNGIDGDDIWVGATGTYLSTVGNMGHNAWWWQDANGSLRSTKLLQITTNGKYVRGVQGLRNSFSIAGKAASLTKIAGNTLGGIGVCFGIYDMTQNGVNISNSMETIMGATTFIPVVGWIISGTYFTASFVTELSTGKSIAEHTQNWVNTL